MDFLAAILHLIIVMEHFKANELEGIAESSTDANHLIV